MIIKPHEFILKNGEKAVLRSPEIGDVDELIRYLNLTAKETNFIARSPEDCYKYTADFETQVIAEANDATNRAMIVCEVGDKRIAGNCEISWKNSTKLRHTAHVGIALCKTFWHLGIGTEMFKKMIEIAEDDAFITQMKLTVVEGNDRARALYEKFGFRLTGVDPRAIRLSNGDYLDQYQMMKILDKKKIPY